jgi:hypothetical protein
MNSKTLEALQGSIHKWERIVAGEGRDFGPLDCPLCEVFNSTFFETERPGLPACTGCPVKEATQRSGCAGSPYEPYAAAVASGEVRQAVLQRLAQVELDFLKSLLPRRVHR